MELPGTVPAVALDGSAPAWLAGIELVGVPGPGPIVHGPDHAASLLRPAGAGGPWVLAGPRTTARYHARRPGPLCVRLRLRPGAAADLLGRPLTGLADREVTVGGPLTEGRADRNRLVDDAVSLLSVGEPVHAVARRLHVSERHLRTLVTRATGLTPTAFVRIDRVRSVLTGAGHAGYYDQSHLIAEFRRVMGVPPGAYAKGHRPPLSPCPPPPRPTDGGGR